MRRLSVVFTPRAHAQLDDLYDYIAERSGTTRAEKYVGALVAACRGLSTFPRRGTRRDDIRPGLRTFGYRRRVTIAFSVEDRTVAIHGVFYGGQDFERRLSGGGDP